MLTIALLALAISLFANLLNSLTIRNMKKEIDILGNQLCIVEDLAEDMFNTLYPVN